MDKYEYFVERAAAAGNARALYLCALLRLQRKDKNISVVVQLLKRAISCGESLACYDLGMLYESFESGMRSVFSAAEMYAKGFERGDLRTAAKIGDLCMAFVDADCSVEEFCINDAVVTDDICGDRNFMEKFVSNQISGPCPHSRYRKAAKNWYEIGVAVGSGYAHYRLAQYREREWSLGDDVKSLLGLYQKAAECGESKGALSLGRIYEEGNLVAKDLCQAKQWYSTAAGMGSAEATYRLGVLLECHSGMLSKSEEMGYVSPRKYPSLYYELESLAKKGDAKAQYDMACILVNGKIECDGYYMGEIERDEGAARLLFRKSAALGFIRAYGMLGVLEERGNKGLLETPHKNRWYTRGAAVGLGYACWKLYKERCRVLSDYSQNVAGLKENPKPINMWTLGRIYDDGLLKDPNSKTIAYQFYRKAGDAGFTPGLVSACKMLIQGIISDSSLNVCQVLAEAAVTGDVGAVYWLAYCMEKGLWCECNLHGAIRLYYLAANFGNVSAMVGYGRASFCFFGQRDYRAYELSVGSMAENAVCYLSEIADAVELKNRYLADVKPSEYLAIAIEKGNNEALEVMARYWAAPHSRNCERIYNGKKYRHNLYLEENLKKSISYFERAIMVGRLNLAGELNLAQQRLKKCVNGECVELAPGAFPVSKDELPF